MELPPLYIFCGIGLALSILGFFLKKIKVEVDELKEQVRKDQILNARQQEKLLHIEKVLEDRRRDVKELHSKFK